ncbi:MAG: holo-ACP synthase [Chloroherpetonaceae bacterium]|nr:holo-ACP synthase [Chloroherpetonaceae bacterium]MCS7211752.1 holo-ACP synthase [Chloroherpetonaceae bacterium]MDW8018771.1 holo-ACP synthase [Chloroherpetonaceae bacterium]MDW8465965.1 holo-ACP synthase [Chloroherpetonaceae bacterium]
MRLGIDIIEIARIQASIERYGERFVRRILTPSEIAYCYAKANPYESIAARFACKEALAKALGTGISKTFHWHSVEILRGKHGEPKLRFLKKIRGLSAKRVAISISHTHQYAVAVAIISS